MNQAGIRGTSSGQRKTGRNALHFGVIALAATVLIGCSRNGGLRVTDLRTQYKVNPLGIGTAMPQLSWILQSDAHNCTQSAYSA